MIFDMIIKTENHGSDLLVWVELRGFEPLTPSMRTRCATGLRYSPKGMAVSVANLAARLRRRQVPRGGPAGWADRQSPTARTSASAYWS
jgi:hypothetical protein